MVGVCYPRQEDQCDVSGEGERDLPLEEVAGDHAHLGYHGNGLLCGRGEVGHNGHYVSVPAVY